MAELERDRCWRFANKEKTKTFY